MSPSEPNLLPPLSDDEYLALKADIARRGVLVPIEIDAQTGAVLDGAHRLRACRELGLAEPPQIVRELGSQRERDEHALILNLLRRQLGPIAWAHAFEQLLTTRGIERGSGARNDLATSANVAQVAAELGVSSRTAFRRLALADQLADHPDLARRVDHGELHHAAAIDQAHLRANQRARSLADEQEAAASRLPVDAVFVCASFQDAIESLPEGSVDLLLTDPPYGIDYRQSRRRATVIPPPIAGDRSPGEAAKLLSDALALLTSKLAPDAHALVFCSWRVEPAFRDILAEAGMAVRSSLVWAKEKHGVGDTRRAFAPMHERILHATRGDALLHRREPDVVSVARVRSPQHRAEKPVELLTRLIRATTAPGALVADPFAGVASTLVAALRTGRRAWGCEIDHEHHRVGTVRLRDESREREVA